MLRPSLIFVASLLLLCPSFARAQAKLTLAEHKDRNLDLEKKGMHRAAYVGWSEYMKRPDLKDLQKPAVQQMYFYGYYFSMRSLARMAMHDKDIKDRQKFINGAANMIFKLENAKSRVGWEIIGRKFQILLQQEEFALVKKAYDKLRKDLPVVD